MARTPDRTTVRAWARLVRAHRAAMRRIEQALKAADLPPLAWYDALLELERAGDDGLRPFELQRAMLLEQYNLSRLLTRLESEELVRRQVCEDDGRGQIVVLTAAGRALRGRMWDVYGPAIQAVMAAGLSAEELRILDELLGRLGSTE